MNRFGRGIPRHDKALIFYLSSRTMLECSADQGGEFCHNRLYRGSENFLKFEKKPDT